MADQVPFDPNFIRQEPFYVTLESPVQVEMMSLSETFNYLEYSDWDCKILELPYQDDKASMIILLPNAKDGLGRLEEAAAMETLNAALDQMRPASIHLRLPKFKLEQTIDLKDHLKALGMVDLFDANVVDLSGIRGTWAG